MTATRWNWPSRDRQRFWERMRVLATDVGEPIVHWLEVPGAFVPGAGAALAKVRTLFGSDLNISELDSAEVLQPLDGRPAPFSSEDGSSPVFIDGVKASLTIAHNGLGDAPILLERVDLQVLARRPEVVDAYEVAPDASKIFGAGFVEPMRFFVELGTEGPGRARRTMPATNGQPGHLLVAESDNFLDTNPASFLTLGPKEPPAMLRLTISALDPGLYSVCLRLFYRVAAQELRQQTSLPVLIYGRGD